MPIINETVESDKKAHRKQRHTAKKIFERLRDEHSYSGGYTTVSTAVRTLKQQNKEVFFPLSHPAGTDTTVVGTIPFHTILERSMR